ncbi:MAG TPA: hypothetical protein VGD92_03265, partial [Sphingobacteriaceae bacterium]
PKFRSLFQTGTFTVIPNPLDALRKDVLNIAGMTVFVIAAAIAAAGFYVTAAAVFSMALVILAVSLLRSATFSVPEKVMIGQSMLNMLLMTLAFGSNLVPAVIGLNSGCLALILVWWTVSKAKKKEPFPAPENYFV